MIADLLALLSSLPPYFIVTFFLAFILWSKFLREGKFKKKLGINDIDDILDLITITMVLLAIIWSLPFVLKASLNTFELSITPQTDITPDNQVLIVGSYLLLFLLVIRKNEYTKKELKEVYDAIVFLYILMIVALISLTLTFHITDRLFLPKTILLLITAVFFLMVIILFGATIFHDPKKEAKKSLKSKVIELYQSNPRGIVSLFSLFVLFGGGPYLVVKLSQPAIVFTDEVVDYTLINPEMAFENIRRDFDIHDLGRFGLIPIPLEYSGLEINDVDEDLTFKQNVTKKGVQVYMPQYALLNRPASHNEYGIEDFYYDNRTNTQYIKFDSKKFVEQSIFGFEIQGRRRENISGNFVIQTPDSISCREKNCTLYFKFENNLNRPIHGEKLSLLPPKEIIYKGKDCNNHIGGGSLRVNDESYYIDFQKSYDKENNHTLNEYTSRGGEFKLIMLEKELDGHNESELKYLHAYKFGIGANTIVTLNLTQNCKT